MKGSVFVTDAPYKHTLGIVRSLGTRGLDVYCGSGRKYAVTNFSRYVKQSLVYPDPKNREAFKTFIELASRRFSFDVIIPVGYTTTFTLSKVKKEIPNIRIAVSDFETLRIAASKKETILLAQKLDIPLPNTTIVESFSELDHQVFSYPLVVKGVMEGGFVRYAYNLQSLKKSVTEIYQTQREYPLLQEYISGTAYGFFALFNEGEPRAIFMHKRIREHPSSGGPSTCAESVYEPKLLEYGLKLLKALDWHGVAMVEFKKDVKDNSYKLMEINPKFWGSLDLSIASGVDFPYLLYKMVVEGDVKPVFSYRHGVRFMWAFPDDFLRTFDDKSAIIPFLSDLFNPRVVKNIDLDDLFPNLMQFADAIYTIVTQS
jgi:predicted ATP-grasp superfamily ATP-dependent carboligase